MFDFSLSRPKPRPYVRVTWDTEGFLLAPLVQAPPVASLSFRVDGGRVNTVGAGDEAFDRVVESLFSDDSLLLVAHYAAHDVVSLMARGAANGKAVEWAQMLLRAAHLDRLTDTMLREQLFRAAEAKLPYSTYRWNLGAACERWQTRTQPNKQDAWRLRYGTLYGTHVSQWPAEALKYTEDDVRATDELYVAQQAKAPWLVDEFRQCRASISLKLMSTWGIKTDPVQAKALYDRTKAELDAAQALCQATEQTFVRIKTRSVKKVKQSYEVTVTEPLIRPNGKANKRAAEARLVAAYAALGKEPPRGEPTEKMVAKAEAAQEDGEVEGNLKLNEAACVESQDPILIAYTHATQAKTLLGKAVRYSHPVLQPILNTLGACTNRTSCSQGDDPEPGEAPRQWGAQTQNLQRDVTSECPQCDGSGKDVLTADGNCKPCGGKGEVSVWGARECMVAREGTVMFDGDFSMMELRALGQYELWEYGVSKLASILNDPKRDCHVELGAAIESYEVELVYSWSKATKGSKEAKLFKLVRQLAKGFNFGGPGGSGGEAMVKYCKNGYGVDVELDQAKKILAFLKTYYPERRRYLADANTAIKNGYWQRLPDGSRKQVCRMTLPYSGFVRGGMCYTDRANFPFQGLAAACAKESMWRVTVECYAVPTSPAFGSRPNNFVHDQIVGETPEAGFRPAIKRLEALWVGGAQEICKGVLILAPFAACRRFSKEAGDPVYDDDGQLMVYEDYVLAQAAKKKVG